MRQALVRNNLKLYLTSGWEDKYRRQPKHFSLSSYTKASFSVSVYFMSFVFAALKLTLSLSLIKSNT